MHLHTPIRILPGSTKGVYVHSACLGDEQIVYANQRHKVLQYYYLECVLLLDVA
jgi:hypothetical protein